MHCEKPIQVDCCTCQTVATCPFHGFAVGVSVMTFVATYAYDGETDALSDAIGDYAGDFHLCVSCRTVQQNHCMASIVQTF